MKTNLIIVEDEFTIAMDVEMRLKKLGYNIIGIVDNADSAVKLAEEESPDLVLMDINIIGELSGIDAAKKIHTEFFIPVVFLTAHGDRKTFNQALEADPYGYIIKPFKDVDLQNAIEIALNKHSTAKEERKKTELAKSLLSGQLENEGTNSEHLFVKDKNGLHKINVEDIMYLEALDNYCHIHINGDRYTVHSYLKDVVEKINHPSFVRVHRSYVVNLNKIQSIKEDQIILSKITVPISRSYKNAIMEKINLL
ncbi:MAG: two component transcriptional regulator, LytTR family [Bacteroidetes bacterium]|jgi:DNA-binding LytR/AlgR family response regulator|nr:two component transcriptional regulator, LytTR family [Bacteroidota bacterium]